MPYEDDLGELVEPPKKIAKVMQDYHPVQPIALDTNWKKYLASLTVDDLLKDKHAAGKSQLVVVDSTSSIVSVLHTLAEKNILSAPVMDRGRNASGKCMGFVDVLDMVALAFKTMRDSNQALQEFYSNPFFEKKISDVMAMSNFAFDDWKPVEETTTLLEALNAFTRPTLFRPHRLPVVNVEGTVIGIISQSDIVSIAAKNKRLLGNCLHKTIEELKLEHAVIAARSTVPVRDVLGLLTDNRVHGIAVVEHPMSTLVANLSASDLRGMTRKDLALFDKPVLEFLQAIYAKNNQTLAPPISCRPKTEFDQILTLLDEHDIHRVYVTDDSRHAIGVVSMSDVVSTLKNC